MSILFDNVDDYADTSGTPPVVGYPCTVSVWGQTDAVGSQDRLVHLGRSDGTNVDAFVLRLLATGALQVTVVAATTPETSNATTTNVISDTGWHHYCGIFASSTSRSAYLDGVSPPGTNTGSRTPTANFAKYRLGTAMDLAEDWNGRIAHVAVWNVALSEANIQSLAAGANPLTIENANLVWYCPTLVNETPMQDRIAAYDLTLGGNAAYNSDNPTVDAEVTIQFFQYQSRFNPLLRM